MKSNRVEISTLSSSIKAAAAAEHQQQQQLEIAKEPFQVIWSRLSFEVRLNPYDKFISKASKAFASIFPLTNNKSNNNNQNPTSLEEKPSDQSINKAENGTDDVVQWQQQQQNNNSNSNSRSSNNKRIIFENLNGLVKSGEISAILGPSGAGKTSLLNAICGRTENYRGQLQLVGGGKRRMRLSIIPQKDYLLENLTVRENLLYSSRILNTSKNFDHEGNILRVIRMLNLDNCLDCSVGKISGGEYKRVSIGQELLRQPDILILDEPTSGLDSLNCKYLLNTLVQLIEASRKGTIQPIAIVMTIHQPDIDIFQMFDRVYCMARRGRVIFEGHPSQVLSVIREHAQLGEEVDSLRADGLSGGMGVNPANLLIEIASEHIYGQEPIERLAQFQRDQFQLETGQYLHQLAQQQQAQQAQSLNNSPTLDAHRQKVSAAGQQLQQHTHQMSISSKNTSLTSLACSYYSGANFDCQLVPNPHHQQPHHTATEVALYNPNTTNVQQHKLTTSNNNNRECHLVRDKKLAPKSKHSGQFWHHTNILARRAFTSTLRDPLMTLTSLLFHLCIPFVMWTVYNPKIGSSKACPLLQREMDIISMVSNHTLNKVGELQDEVMMSLECSTMFFLSIYSFSMCSLSIAALAFPLNMHVLLKEVRNGWYNLPAYVVAKTIATFPFECLFPVFSSMMIWVLLGMPSSYLEWRLWAIALVTGLIAMISHTQGLIFGAICMNSVQTAIFMASSSTLPQSLLSGFTARIRTMPWLLQKLSWLSMYRFSSDTTNMIRFGFSTCPCDDSTEEYLTQRSPTFTDIPQQMKPLFSFYLTNTAEDPNAATTTISPLAAYGNSTLSAANMTAVAVAGNSSGTTEQLVSNYLPSLITGLTRELTVNTSIRNDMIRQIENNEIDLFGRMAALMTRSFTYGRQVDNCAAVRSELLTQTGAPKDEYLPLMLLGMFLLLVVYKVALFIVVKIKIGSNI